MLRRAPLLMTAASPLRLRAIGWDHPRCMDPMRACSEVWKGREDGFVIEWEARSLTAFGDQKLDELAERYDLLTVDHPFCGEAEATGCLTPMDSLLSAAQLRALEDDSAGPSYDSYVFHGHLWAVPIDAAGQVAAVRPDLLPEAELPESWEAAVRLAERLKGGVTLPLAPAHSISSFLTISANLGGEPAAAPDRLVDRAAGLAALDILGGLHRAGRPEATSWEPPQVLDLLTSSDELLYVPLTYGYVTYSLPRPRRCRFLDIPARPPVGAVLGGVGLAVSSHSRHQSEAARFAAWVSGAEAQRLVVGPAGGQVSSEAAWTDRDLDAASGGFFSATRASLEQAWVRPRERWWPGFQLEGGRSLTASLVAGDSAERALAALQTIYLGCRAP